MLKSSKIFKLYNHLLKKHGHPKKLWPQWCAKSKNEKLRQLIAIGAILTQRTSWRNAEKALINLKKKNLLSTKQITELDIKKLTKLIRVAGFYTTKPKRLREFCNYVISNYGDLSKMRRKPTDILRKELLEVYGVGPETADTLLLFALDKPSFIVDEYTKRFVGKYSLADTRGYDDLKKLFESSLQKSVEIYQNYHVLMIVDQKGKEWCLMGSI
jgi:endonuclease-3 related protein